MADWKCALGHYYLVAANSTEGKNKSYARPVHVSLYICRSFLSRSQVDQRCVSDQLYLYLKVNLVFVEYLAAIFV